MEDIKESLLSKRIITILLALVVMAGILVVVSFGLKHKGGRSNPNYVTPANKANAVLSARGFRIARDALLPESFTCGSKEDSKVVGSSTYAILCRTLPNNQKDTTKVKLAWKSSTLSNKEWTTMVAKEVLLASGGQGKGNFVCEKDQKLSGGLRGERRFCTVSEGKSAPHYFAIYFFTAGASQGGTYALYSYNNAVTYDSQAKTIIRNNFDTLAQNIFVYVPKTEKKSSLFAPFIERAYAQDAGGDAGTGDSGAPAGDTGDTGDTGTPPADSDIYGGGNEPTPPVYTPPTCTAPQYLSANWYCYITIQNGDSTSDLNIGTITGTTESDAAAQCTSMASGYSALSSGISIVSDSGQCVGGATPAVQLNFSLFDFVEKVFASR